MKKNKDISLTRQLKYKDLQKLTKKEKEEEDIYLTKSFKPMKPSKKMKKVFLNFFLLLCILFSLGLLIFFFIYPFLVKTFFLSPKTVFYKSLDFIEEKTKMEEETINMYSSFISQFSFDTNIEEINELNQYSYILNHKDKENQYIEFQVKKEDMLYEVERINKENQYFLHHKGSDQYYNLEDVYKEPKIVEVMRNLLKNPKRYNSLMEKEINYLKETMDEKDMSKAKDELILFGQEKKVTRYTYQLRENNLNQFVENHNRFLLQDDDFIDDLADVLSLSKGELQTFLKEQKTPFQNITFNIYLEKGNTFVGFDIEIDGFRRIYYYKEKGRFVFYVSLNKIENIKEKEQHIIEISNLENNQISIKYNDKELFSFIIKTFSENKIEFSYLFYGYEENKEGSFLLSKEEDCYNYDFSIKKKEEYLKWKGTIKKDQEENKFTPSIENSVSWNKEEFEKEILDSKEKDVSTSLKKLYKKIVEIFKDKVEVREEQKEVEDF